MAISKTTAPIFGSEHLLDGVDDDSSNFLQPLRAGAHVDVHTAATAASASALATPAIVSTFIAGTLNVFDGAGSDSIDISRNAAGQILVNNGAVSTVGGTPTVANTSVIRVFGQGGNDVITLNEANGALPSANLFGGAGNDVLTGGSSADLLFGQADDDTLLGKGGADQLFGGDGNDVLIGGDGNDQMFGEAGNDRMIWNPGDDSDLMEGGDGTDTAEVNGGNGSEVFSVTANGTRVRFDRIDPAPFNLDIGTTENLVVNMNGGDDTFTASGNLSPLIHVTVDGGAGNDTISGSNGADLLIGGDGNDFIDGQQGNDTVLLGAGDDVFQWDPGDGSDVVEGQAGADTMLFNGANIAETFDLSANGERLRLTRNVGNVVMDVNGVERVDLNALGGADTVNVGDLSGTNVTQLNINLAGVLGGTAGDGQADTVIAAGTNNADTIDVVGAGSSVSVVGLPATINITNSEGANDSLVINAGAGNDTINASTLGADITRLTIDGGTGDDTILGSRGADVLIGGDGNDFIDGQQGNDVARLGAGNDTFQWDPGDGSDVVEGEAGTDTMLFNGANISENIDISANGGRVQFFRDVANITMDLNGVEVIDFHALGGADNIVVGDLSGTDVTKVNIDLSSSVGGPDGSIDSITTNGTQGIDTISVVGDATGLTVAGLHANVDVVALDGTDRLTIDGLGGDDVIDASHLDAGAVQLTLNGGLGADTLIGSQGDDLIIGGDGNDVALMGAGNDTFVWNPGDDNDTVEGQAGFDTLLFNGANIAENIAISANGDRTLMTRDVANITMDLNGIERIEFNALGGADSIVVNNLSGTDVTEVAINLAAAGGVGDGQADTVTVNGTNSEDVALLFGDSSGVSVLGLSATINVTGAEAANDRIVINTQDGDDVIDASGVAVGTVGLTLNGGAGNDIIIGSAGDDILIGGTGDDVLIGNGGNDIFDAGPGDNVIIQGFVAGAGTVDMIDLTNRGITFDWLMAHATEVDGSTTLDLGDQHITLSGVSMSSLHQDDFMV
jgi:Ca2+-binding RTX toxin-like protein